MLPPEPERFYVVVRGDISPGYQIAQSIHAKDLFTHKFPEIEEKWFNGSNTIVILEAESQDHLWDLHVRLYYGNRKSVMFFEPDMDEWTALAAEPGEKTAYLLRELKTAGK